MNQLDFNTLDFDQSLAHEWLAVNKIGGYACATIPGLNSRKYHGLLVAAMSPPVRRMVLLSRVEETVRSHGCSFALATNEYPGAIFPEGHKLLRAFNPDPFPRWGFQADGWTMEKSLRLLAGENTVCLTYTLLGGDQCVSLELRPLLALRGIHELMYQWNGPLAAERGPGNQVRIPATSRTPEVFLSHDGEFVPESCWYLNTIYRREMERGYSGLEDLWMPGVVRWTLSPGQTVHFICSADPIEFGRVISVMDRQFTQAVIPAWPADTSNAEMDALVRTADQFVVSIPGSERAEPVAAVMPLYPWSNPRGRDTLIGLPGLFLVPGKFAAARTILETFAANLQNGLMPSEWPEDGAAPVYHGADVSLWFVNATWQYLLYTGDDSAFRRGIFDTIIRIIDAYEHGTGLGIKADATGLISTHESGVATTWMDAKVCDWLVTPRQGRTVEINALWYNALCIARCLAERLNHPDHADRLTLLATAVKQSFNVSFWNAKSQCLLDVIDDHGHDSAVRPNQLWAIALPFPVLDRERQPAVLKKVTDELLLPLGVRTLSPKDPCYQGHFAGDVVHRDRAYHQGCAFPWLLGPFASAYLHVNGRSESTRQHVHKMLSGCLEQLTSHGLGQIGELFDGNAPHAMSGAFASGLAAAELLRVYAEDVLDLQPTATPRPPATSATPVVVDK